jgi:hypothetical protein
MDGHNTGVAKVANVIHLYIRIAKRRAEEGKGIVVRTPALPEEQLEVDDTR